MLAFLFDENIPRKIIDAALRHNLSDSTYPLDVVAIGDSDAPSLSTLDPDILKWVEVEGRLLVTRDVRSMANYLVDHLQNGGSVPGILEIRRSVTVPILIETLVLIAHAGLAGDYENQIHFIP
jgi:Domain of unknown function (DUF5615)